jgi:cytochrome c-type biogenesis protein
MQQIYELLGSVTHLSPWVYLFVLLGGFASAVSPCYYPVLAIFGGYIGGYAPTSKAGAIRLALLFVLGNALTLAVTGVIASVIGSAILTVFTGYQLDRWIPGIVGVLMALRLLGILNVRMPVLQTPVSIPPSTGLLSFGFGLPFGLVITPCTIPIFVTVLTFVALQGNAVHGALLMVAYTLGRGIILAGVAASVGFVKMLNLVHVSQYFVRGSGILMLLVSIGLLLFYNGFARFVMAWTPM